MQVKPELGRPRGKEKNMSFIKLAFFGIVCLVLLSISPVAFAQCAACEVQNIDPGPGGWGDEDPIMDSATYRNPTPTSCTATSSKNQRCRSCEPKYYNNGTPAGYDVCAYVDRTASCSCNFTTNGCSNQGSCTYNYW